MIKYFDAHIRLEGIGQPILEDLAYFGVSDVLIAAHAPTQFETSEDLLSYFNRLITDEVTKVRKSGLKPWVALGVQLSAAPRRSHPEIWHELPRLLSDPCVVAVGELFFDQGSQEEILLLTRQLELAGECNKSVLVTVSRGESVRKIKEVLKRVKEVGLDPRRVIVNHVDETGLRVVVMAGCWAGVTLGPLCFSTAGCVELITEFIEFSERGVLVNGGLRAGPVDILALPKVALALKEAGVSSAAIEKMMWGNACSAFCIQDP
jgi:hypothetical protein